MLYNDRKDIKSKLVNMPMDFYKTVETIAFQKNISITQAIIELVKKSKEYQENYGKELTVQ